MHSSQDGKKNILVTGASGFVGSPVLDSLANHSNFSLRAAVRRLNHNLPSKINVIQVGDLAADTDWDAAVQDIDAVIHAAARVHVMRDVAPDSLAEFRRVNVEGTLNLARQAAAAGVKRFIFVSSIKVNGEETPLGKPCRADDLPAPADPYGISKLEAEQGLQQLAKETGMEVVIIRPPLVYGPGVKANFQTMMRWLDKNVPLPLGAIHNKRSFVALDNLVDLIITCIDHPDAANQIFLAGDDEDLSTTELLQRMSKAMGKPARLIPVPARVLELGAILLGKRDIAQRLCGNLQVDISKAREMLGWTPPVSVNEGLKRAVADFKVSESHSLSPIIRVFDVVFSVCGLVLCSPLFLLLSIIGFFDSGSPIFRQERVGRDQMPFTLVKFRTMKLDTASVASHLAEDISLA